jgi:hypothetical protein
MPLHQPADAEVSNLADEDVPFSAVGPGLGDHESAARAIDAERADDLAGAIRALEPNEPAVGELARSPRGNIESTGA